MKRVAELVRAIQDDDETLVASIIDVGRSRRLFAPLAFAVGALAMLLQGVRLLLSNWRLTLVQILPAMWIWLATFDLKAHVLHGKSFHVLRGPVLIPIGLAIVAITAASFYLNAVFGFAISGPRPPQLRPAFDNARAHMKTALGWGAGIGVLLAFATTVTTRWGGHWFTLSLGIVIALMMTCYVAVPARMIGVEQTHSVRDKLTASALGGTLGAAACTPPYLLARLGILMLGSKVLLIPGILLLTLGTTLQAGATGAVRAVKMGAKLIAQPAPEGTSTADE